MCNWSIFASFGEFSLQCFVIVGVRANGWFGTSYAGDRCVSTEKTSSDGREGVWFLWIIYFLVYFLEVLVVLYEIVCYFFMLNNIVEFVFLFFHLLAIYILLLYCCYC